MWRGRTTSLALGLALAVGCGGSVTDGGSSGTGGGMGGGTGGGSGGGTAAGGGGGLTGGSGGADGGGSAGTAGLAGGGPGGAAGAAGAGGGLGVCQGLDYCDCSARTDCLVLSEACYCPCGERCLPDCACGCGGGAYLGCTGASLWSPGQLPGTWLVGWSGGLNHFSWVRLDDQGNAWFLDGATIAFNAPIWACNGQGTWDMTQRPETLQLRFPAACNLPDLVLTFERFRHPEGYPPGADLAATVLRNGDDAQLEAYRLPMSWCAPDMSSCPDPFQ